MPPIVQKGLVPKILSESANTGHTSPLIYLESPFCQPTTALATFSSLPTSLPLHSSMLTQIAIDRPLECEMSEALERAVQNRAAILSRHSEETLSSGKRLKKIAPFKTTTPFSSPFLTVPQINLLP